MSTRQEKLLPIAPLCLGLNQTYTETGEAGRPPSKANFTVGIQVFRLYLTSPLRIRAALLYRWVHRKAHLLQEVPGQANHTQILGQANHTQIPGQAHHTADRKLCRQCYQYRNRRRTVT